MRQGLRAENTLVFLIGASIATGVVAALTFPFGLLAVRLGAVTVAVMSALTNIIWAVSGMVGPTVGGAFAEWAGDRTGSLTAGRRERRCVVHRRTGPVLEQPLTR